MTRALERFLEAAGARGVVPDVRAFPQGTKTANDAARAIGCNVEQIVKSLVFLVDGAAVLVLTSGVNRVDPAKLAALCGGMGAKRATPEEAREATGYAVGGTPPFGHREALRAFVDPHLLAFDIVWAAAGTPDTVFPVEPAVLVRLAGATSADFTEARTA